MEIKKLEEDELNKVAEIALENFKGHQKHETALKWTVCNFNSHPRMQYFIAKENEEILGYILWMEKGGFRKNSVWELEQIAVRKIHQGKGVGKNLIKESLEEIKKHLQERGSKLKLIEVTTGTDNEAQHIYRKHLGAEIEAVVKDFFRGDEVIMIKRFD
jgi:ribosomal protein S18 acetylase RimI-like enzyme